MHTPGLQASQICWRAVQFVPLQAPIGSATRQIGGQLASYTVPDTAGTPAPLLRSRPANPSVCKAGDPRRTVHLDLFHLARVNDDGHIINGDGPAYKCRYVSGNVGSSCPIPCDMSYMERAQAELGQWLLEQVSQLNSKHENCARFSNVGR